MPKFNTLEPTRDKFFHVEWETTLKCNLDCSYCGDGHNNSLEHPSLASSIATADFIFEYVNYYMEQKPQDQRHVNINIFGGESLFHPNIIDILTYARKKRDSFNNFSCNISTITNGIVGKNLWKKIVELLDYFTISFHAESLPKQQKLLKSNILYLKENKKHFQVNIMMHPKYWNVCVAMEKWCKDNDIHYHKRQIDHDWFDRRFNYTPEQTEYLTGEKPVGLALIAIASLFGTIDLSSQGRACCGGQKLCLSGQDSDYVYGNNFKNWSCSVNEFFLYIRQNTGEVFTNKDCKMNFNGSIGPLGHLSDTQKILDSIKQDTVIVCKNKSCWCGLCTPKAKTRNDFDKIMTKYRNK